MEFVVKPVTTDIRYRVIFKEPQFELIKQEPRISMLSKIMKNFDLHLNDIRFSDAALSNDYLHFSKFYDATFFNVAFGLEEVEASLQRVQNEDQVEDLYGKLAQLFEQNPISLQRVTIQRHLSTEENVSLFLESLNPNPPSNFKKYLCGTGAYYTLTISDHNLSIYITIVESLFIQKGLYLSVENEFSPNKYDFQETFKIVKEFQEFILKGLDLYIKDV